MGVGWSLGANILVRYLGEEKEKTPLKAAVSLCNPFDLVMAIPCPCIFLLALLSWLLQIVHCRAIVEPLTTAFTLNEVVFNDVSGFVI